MNVFRIECFKNKYRSEEDRYLGCYSKHNTFEEALSEIDKIMPHSVQEKFPEVDMTDFQFHIHQRIISCGKKVTLCRYIVNNGMYKTEKHRDIYFDGIEELEALIRKVIRRQSEGLLLEESPPKLKATIEKFFRV